MTHTSGPWSFKAVVRPDGYRVESDGSFVCEAKYIQDARLIAAAPDLLEAAKLAKAKVCNHESGHQRQFADVWDALEAAIDKAEGRS